MKWLIGIVLGIAALVAGLYLVFRVVVQPKSATVKAAAPTIRAAPTDTTAQRIQAAGSFLGDLGGAAADLGLQL